MTIEKSACQFIEIDKPIFRESKHASRDSMSSSQAADHSHPRKREWSLPSLLLLSQKNIFTIFWVPDIVGKNFVRSVISDVHAAGNDGISFYSVVCGRRNSLQEGFFDKLSGGRRVFCGRRSL